MDIHCPRCRTRYRLDDDLTPRRVLKLRCAACRAEFRVDLTETARRDAVRDRTGAGDMWARRLARTLVSDMVVYNRARRDKALADGSLLDEFADELAEAWDAFREQTGGREQAPLFRDAVNSILAAGRPLL